MQEPEEVKEPFRIGNSVRLELISRERGMQSFPTRVEDSDDRHLVLQTPVDRGVPLRLEVGWTVTLIRSDDRTQRNYVAQVQVVENRPGNMPLLVVTRPTHFETVSRRRYYRCDVRIPIELAGRAGEVRNLSGSGMLAVVDGSAPWHEGATLEFQLALPMEKKPLSLKGRVVRRAPVADGRKTAVGMEFVELSEPVREQLIRYVFIRQRELIRKSKDPFGEKAREKAQEKAQPTDLEKHSVTKSEPRV